jgi:hypothetical protein
MHLHRRGRSARRRSSDARWREACVDGVMHAAFAAAIAAETAAQRCASHLPGRRSRRWHRLRR